MARSRHGRTGGGSRPGDSGLPTWAQRHLDEAGEPDLDTAGVATPRHHRRAAAEPSRLRGWGVAIVSVAAAVGAVPLAISSVANDHSGDPLPKVDTYTAGSPAPLQADGGEARPDRGRPAGTDPATADVLDAPPAASAGGPPVAAPAFAAPQPAAAVRPTPRVVAPTTTTSTTTTTTTTTEGRSATKPPRTSSSTPPKSASKPKPSDGGSDGGSGDGGGGGLVGNLVGGVTRTAGGAVDGLLGG